MGLWSRVWRLLTLRRHRWDCMVVFFGIIFICFNIFYSENRAINK